MIKQNLSAIKARIASVCAKTGRNPQEITVVAVSKGRPLQQIKEAIAEGITDIGENRVQEALLKYDSIRTTQDARLIKWHMLGHLQTNKVKEAVKLFDLIQSVDSLCLAEEISRQASRIGKVQDVLIEIKTSPEAAKFGLKPQEAVEVIKKITEFKNVNIKGLMTIAPMVDSPEKTRPYFRMLKDLQTKIYELRVTNYELRVLSMGMSSDFEVAIEEGANMLRLGRIVFEGLN